MTNEQALLRLGRNMDDASALIAIAENNFSALKVAVRRHFTGRAMRKRAFLTLLVQISWYANEFMGCEDDARKWIAACVERECSRLRGETRGGLAVN
jgi:hypothetical protein